MNDWTIPDGVSTFDCGGYPIAYVERGSGHTVVLVHGSLGDYRAWAPQLDALSDAYRMIALSQRHCFPEPWDGNGDGYSIEQHASDLLRFVEWLGVPVTLLGFSRGGVVATEAVRSRPDLFASLVLVEPGLFSLLSTDGRPFEDPATAAAASAAELISGGDLEGGLRCLIDSAGGAGAWDNVPEERRALRRANAWTLVGQARERRPRLSSTDLKPLQMPIMLCAGERGMARYKEILDAIQACLPHAERVTIPGAGHVMNATHPDAFNAVLRSFLKRREGRGLHTTHCRPRAWSR
jgi:pimeloyl-ACP methyl ester carboxylesterase